MNWLVWLSVSFQLEILVLATRKVVDRQFVLPPVTYIFLIEILKSLFSSSKKLCTFVPSSAHAVLPFLTPVLIQPFI